MKVGAAVEKLLVKFAKENWDKSSTADLLADTAWDIYLHATDEFSGLIANAARADASAAHEQGRKMGVLYSTLPYKYLYKWLSQEACLDQEAPFFDHTILLDTEEPERDYDEKCQSLQDQVAEEWREIAASHTGSNLWRAQMKQNNQDMEAGAIEFVRWELCSEPVRFRWRPPTIEQRCTALETKLVEKGLLTDTNFVSHRSMQQMPQESSNGRWGEQNMKWRVDSVRDYDEEDE